MALAFKHASEPPLPPRQLNPAIPLPVEKAILKALAKNRADRFQDVQAFLAALHAPSSEHSDDTTVAGQQPFALPVFRAQTSPTTSNASGRAERFKRGQELYHEERYEEALAMYHHLLQIDPQDAAAYVQMGITLLAMRHYARACTALFQAVEINPHLWEAHQHLAFVLNWLEFYPDALNACEKALRLRPNEPQTYVFKARALSGLQRFDAALLAYYQALYLNPSDAVDIYNETDRMLLQLQRCEEALTCFT